MNKKLLAAIASCICALSSFGWEVRTAETAAPYELTAAQELRDYLVKRLLPGGKVTVAGKEVAAFHIGDTAFSASLGLSSKEMEDEAWRIQSDGDNVALIGGGSRGTLYAVYHLLEDFCDIHWLSLDEESVPAPVEVLSLPKLKLQGKPQLMYRCVYSTSKMDKEIEDNIIRHAVRNRMNHLGDLKIPIAWGGGFDYGTPYHCHTMGDYYITDKEFMESHPEYFSLAGGKRVGGQFTGQHCLSNPEVVRIVKERLLKTIADDRAKARANGEAFPRIYDVSQCDNSVYCQCENCEKIAAQYGQSGVYLLFINQLAKAVKKDYPEIFISTLAYLHTEEAPKGGIVADSNVIIKLCDTQSNFAARMEDDNGIHFKHILDWKDKCENMIIWDYAVTFLPSSVGLPLPSEWRYSGLNRFYKQNNVKGIFWEFGSSRDPYWADFGSLKIFLQAKLMEDPKADADALIKLFMRKYYGSASAEMEAYRKLVDEDCRKNHGIVNMSAPITDYYFFSVPSQIKAHELFDSAEKKAANDKILQRRLMEARLPLDRLSCRYGTGFKLVQPGTQNQQVPQSILEAARKRLASPALMENFKRYPMTDQSIDLFRYETTLFPANDVTIRPPSKFANKKYYDFTAFLIGNLSETGTIVGIKDSDSEAGYVWQLNASLQDYFKLPMVIGHYDKVTLKNDMPDFSFGAEKLPPEGKYQWYNAGTLKVPPHRNYIYISREWTLQASLDNPELLNRTFEVWVSMKFTGKEFYPESSVEKSHVWVERMVLVPVENRQ